MQVDVISLLPKTLGGNLSFPHYLKIEKQFIDVIIEKENQINIGDFICTEILTANSHIYEVKKVMGVRKARGDWSAYDSWPFWCRIEVKYKNVFFNLKQQVA